MGVHVGDGDRRPRQEACPPGSLLAEPAGATADRDHGPRQLVVDDRPESGLQRFEESWFRKAVLGRPERLVAGRAVVPCLAAGQLPDHPVRGFKEPIGGPVDIGRLAQDLERLREEPLGRDLAAVSIEPRLVEIAGDAVDVIRLGLRGVVLPELDPRVRVSSELVEETQRRAIPRGRQHRARREVDPDPDDLGRIDARAVDQPSHRAAERLDVVLRVLERPVRAEDDVLVRCRQVGIDDPVAIRLDLDPDLATVGDVDQDGATRLRAEVDADGVARPVDHGRGGASAAAGLTMTLSPRRDASIANASGTSPSG